MTGGDGRGRKRGGERSRQECRSHRTATADRLGTCPTKKGERPAGKPYSERQRPGALAKTSAPYMRSALRYGGCASRGEGSVRLRLRTSSSPWGLGSGIQDPEPYTRFFPLPNGQDIVRAFALGVKG